ncbi:NUDIX hydrolase [Bacillus sp. RG28]|uniref:NUDIX hydrolase n=1 Tax=Gottfriedia endophytica TaxID=2820819 RepID=A0A940NQB0_9BACI|nr:NUDIX hydrolase [Gottfriedia endophytica]MBP0725603.1 NUDIX hydrolase [Gottfriedia endophytica]
MSKRGNVWIAVGGLVKDEKGRWLVVKKKYSGLKDMWSLPAGFVKETETVDQAILREIKEETGIEAKMIGLMGVRTGVIKGEISDNMLLFLLETDQIVVTIQEKELSEAKFMTEQELLQDNSSSLLIRYLIENPPMNKMEIIKGLDPGDHFNYTTYHLIK